MGFPQRKASFGGAISPRKRLSYSLRPLLKMLPMERRKTMLRLCVEAPVSRSIFHLLLPSTLCRLRLIYCPFFSRLSRDEVRRYKLCSAVVFEVYGLFLRFLPCVYRASAIRVSANPSQGKNVDNGRSLVVAPVLCIQLVSANQYVRKTTKQRACKTVSCPEIALQKKRKLNKKRVKLW